MQTESVRCEDVKVGDLLIMSAVVGIDKVTRYGVCRVTETGRTTCHEGHPADCRWYATVEAIDAESIAQTYRGPWRTAHCLRHPHAAIPLQRVIEEKAE